MILSNARTSWVAVGTVWALASGLPAMADDTELFIGTSSSSTARPNILFIVDNSGSMSSLVLTQEAFDGTTTYPAAGGCDVNRIYWRTGTGNPPACSTGDWFDATALRCDRAARVFLRAGFYTDLMAQYDPSTGSSGRRWQTISSSQKSRVVECRDDAGLHGNGVDTVNLYARNGGTTAGYWGTEDQQVAWGASPTNQVYTLFSGNYLNWRNGPTAYRSRLDIVKDVAGDLLDSVSGVNVGLAYFNRNTDSTNDGGRIAYAMEDIETARGPIQEAIDALVPDGNTPLSEMLYETALYYSGGNVLYGNPNRSVAAARDLDNSARYDSPIGYACQKNFIVLLTDGEPAQDDSADALIRGMTDGNGGSFANLVGSTCDSEGLSQGLCLDDLAEFLYEGDFSSLEGRQNITTYTVGFTVDLPILAQTAARGGGVYYTADDTATLSTALTNIVTAILSHDTSFAAPTVAVNSFNQTQNLSDLFISVFRPSGRAHWPGNLKRYRIRASDAQIVDAQGNPAIDSTTGFFRETARSFWSSVVDGPVADLGGAAALIPASGRRVFTHLSGTDLTSTANRVSRTNAVLTDSLLNIGVPGDPTRDQLIDFMNGIDAADFDQDGNSTERRAQMGDPLHSQPVAMIYGPGLRDGVVFMGTNDGYLHAIDIETGVEHWAFVPPEFLRTQVELFKDQSTANKLYGIDSDIRVQTVADNDGVIEPGEKVYLFFGMGRGGDFYYGLDVSDPASPQLLWKLDSSTLPRLGQTWSPPMPTKVEVAGATQNPDHLALVFGGGYEPDQDNAPLSTDTIGNSIYIVDSVSGALLWHGSRDGTHKDFNGSGRAMDYSIPARIRLVDMDGNGYVDRMYAGDMGGQVWRFDVRNGNSAADLVVGGVIAQLGGASSASPAPEIVRRFYNSPDVAFISTSTGNFLHIGIGSGHRGHPLSTSVEDAFYALRDYSTQAMTQAQYDALEIIEHGDLVPITSATPSVPADGSGWRLDLSIGGWNGEKVLSEARTFANQVFFSTFQPSTGVLTCHPQIGTNRTYVMSVYNGAPVMNLDGSTDGSPPSMSDLYVEATGGILPAAQALFVDIDANNDGIPDAEADRDGDGITDDFDDGIPDHLGNNHDVVCVGVRCFSGVMSNNPVRTFWSQESVD